MCGVLCCPLSRDVFYVLSVLACGMLCVVLYVLSRDVWHVVLSVATLCVLCCSFCHVMCVVLYVLSRVVWRVVLSLLLRDV
jgi:hypothetical protein